MRHISRLPEPDILRNKKPEWTQKFISSGNKRPDSSKYAHRSVRDCLNAMSLHKCFYCERKLKGSPGEVDHYVEVAEKPELAFEWHNLYLACDHCNSKFPNRTIPNAETLDPCTDTDEEISRHLTFEDEIIRPNNNSTKGAQTIRKYKLDSQLQDHQRLQQLQFFNKILIEIQKNCMAEKRNQMNDAEITLLKRFQQADYPFSMMFRILLQKFNFD
jgi:hypothetical protein